ncbi:hypothetical protein GGR57DRAFT_244449 [Xylariaceae sp. FL1272]|nr:hypothetical protein GGR57DRAFT_244449 [Xylariaceae sp. FL1272]
MTKRCVVRVKTEAPTEVGPTTCRLCHKDCHRLITRQSNRNGNAGRPYFKCLPCGKFITWDDDRGMSPPGPVCHCDLPSRRQLSGTNGGRLKIGSRKMHYVCQSGKCNFFSYEDHEPISESLITALAELKVW